MADLALCGLRWAASPIINKLLADATAYLSVNMVRELQKLEAIVLPQFDLVIQAAEKSSHRVKLKEWLRRLKEAFYDAEDNLLKRKAKSGKDPLVREDEASSIASTIMKPLRAAKSRARNLLPQNRKLINKMKELKDILVQAKELRDLLGLPHGNTVEWTPAVPATVVPTTTSLPTSKVFGRDRDRDRIVDFLLGKTATEEASSASLFPKGYRYEPNQLVHFWVAEGFVDSCNLSSRTVEDVGWDYFNDMVSGSFFQLVSERYGSYYDSYYVMHDILHDLAESLSREDCFRLEDDNVTEIPCTVQHLSVHVESMQKHKQIIYKLHHLHTIICIDPLMDDASDLFDHMLRNQRKLRVLYLSFYNSLASKLASMWEVDSGSHIRRVLSRDCSSLKQFMKLMDDDISQHLQIVGSALEEGDITSVKENLIKAWVFCHEQRIRVIYGRTMEMPLVLPSGLCELSLSSCSITDEALAICLDGLISLETLELKYNMALTALPSEEVFEHLTKFELLIVRGCWCLKSLGGLRAAPSLSILHCRDCPSLELTRGAELMPLNLARHLSINGSILVADSFINGLPHLKSLGISDCRSSPSLSIAHLTSLETLYLWGLPDLCIVEGLFSLHLNYLSLIDVPNLSAKCISQFRVQESLTISSSVLLNHMLRSEGFTVPPNLDLLDCKEPSASFEEPANLSSVKCLYFFELRNGVPAKKSKISLKSGESFYPQLPQHSIFTRSAVLPPAHNYMALPPLEEKLPRT
ncbi:unnamed protein product [Miscanthus lutarioriparius]|uniref:Disease resistance protein winged helix domain-containing protein n=1 Tax=Miscanthus lutarioriparius TaxID=422564 RepID=A0A811RKX2_9POAL|nr:unnamed protein product [Miscanthus lutarioriparius]